MTGTNLTLLIRDARDDERAAIRALTLAAYAEYADVMAPTAWAGLRGAVESTLDGDRTAARIVAEHAGALVGSVLLCPPAAGAYGGALGPLDAPELRLLAVLPAARGRGVGAALVRECVRRAYHSGAPALGLHTSDSLSVAMAMYERMGFVRAPDKDCLPPGAELVKGYRLGRAAMGRLLAGPGQPRE